MSLLTWASANDHRTIVRAALAMGSDVNTRDRFDQTALISAARNNSRELVRMLLDKGAEINSKDRHGLTALFWATANGHREVIWMLETAVAPKSPSPKQWESTVLGKTTIPCPSCGQKLRVPSDRGKLEVKCPACGHTWVCDETSAKAGAFVARDLTKAARVSENPGRESRDTKANASSLMARSQSARQPEVEFVFSAVRDLRRSLVHLPPGLRDRWFQTAFNDWYCPAVRRGYRGGMAPVFDIGVVLLEPTAEVRTGDGYGELLRWIKGRPLVGELARRVLIGRVLTPNSSEVRGLVTWTLIEPLLRCLSGVWADDKDVRTKSSELPFVETRLNQIYVHASAYGTGVGTKLDVGAVDSSAGDAIGGGDVGCGLPSVRALAVRVITAQVARLLPELAHKLDFELVDACLLGPLLGTRDHEPPRRSPSDTAITRQSTQPGTIAGVTRVETKRPSDPITDILPSELMILRRARDKGLANILHGRPLIVVHEREWDVVPKHRALVCYIVDAHADTSSHKRAALAERAIGRGYRDAYVYAKRQVFDTLHDLADAQALARRSADIQIEVAVFAVPPGREHAVVHQRILLDELKRGMTGDAGIDRLTEIAALAERIPGFFIRFVSSEPQRSRSLATRHDGDVLPADVARYVRNVAHHGRYRMIHLVLIGTHDRARLLERLHRYVQYQSSTPVKISMIGVDINERDADARLIGLREPAWTYVEAGSLHDAIGIDLGRQEAVSLAQVRARLVNRILAKRSR